MHTVRGFIVFKVAMIMTVITLLFLGTDCCSDIELLSGKACG